MNHVTDSRIGATIGAYSIESLIGRGGMSVVYLAEDTKLKRKVALKLLAPELAEDVKFRERFARESQLAASLDHPNIVPIFEAGEVDGSLYIAMRYVRGIDLKRLIEQTGPLELERTVGIVAQAASALDAAHGAGLVHRDVKPGNILIASAGVPEGTEHVYLSDFGLTKRSTSDSGITATGQFVGTLDYAAPEQFEAQALDGRADVYSLGCVAYECLTGRVPFDRDNEAALVYAHLLAARPKVTGRRPDAPPDIDEVVARAMAIAPKDRFLTCGEFARSLRRALPRQPGEVATRRPRRAWILPTAALVAVALALTAVVALNGRSSPTTQAPTVSAPVNSVATIDPRTNRMTGSIAVDPGPTRIISSRSALWVANPAERTLTRIDPSTGAVRRGIVHLEGTPTGLAPGQLGSVWVAMGMAGSIAQIDPETARVIQQIDLKTCCLGPSSIVADGSTVWVADAGGLHRVDPSSGSVVATIPGTGCAAIQIDGSHHVWVTNGWDSVSRIEPFANTVTDVVALPSGGASSLTMAPAGSADPAGLWIALTQGDQVAKIETTGSNGAGSMSVTGTYPVGNGPGAVAAGNGSIWVANSAEGTVFRLEPQTGRVLARIHVGHRPSGIAFAAGKVWVTIQDSKATAGAVGRLVFDDGGDIWVMNTNGSNRRQLTAGPDSDSDPDWSPDGRRIAFTRSPSSCPVNRTTACSPGVSHIYVMDADGSNPEQVTQGADSDLDVAWSPDGTELAFAREDGDDLRIWVTRLDGTDARELTARLAGIDDRPDWSPDGSNIVFRAGDVGNQYRTGSAQLFVVHPDGSGLTRLTNDRSNHDAPAWSSDGTRIAFSGNQTGYGVYVTSLSGTTTRLAAIQTNNYGLAMPGWSPDGTRLVVSGTSDLAGNLYLLYADGSGVVQLTHDGNAGVADWQPTA
jgi:serine/threonine protein kinase/Tol biopolymer transport system component